MALLSQAQLHYYQNSNKANYGDYQFVSLDHIINGFMVVYVGESKLINKVNRTDVQFHGMRAIQEFSYDTFRSVKAQEIKVLYPKAVFINDSGYLQINASALALHDEFIGQKFSGVASKCARILNTKYSLCF